MTTFYLRIETVSETVFGSGDGVAGLVDIDVQHDVFGCPYLGGRALKGMLVTECADILAASGLTTAKSWSTEASRLFGQPGSTEKEEAILSIGDAQLPSDLREAIRRTTGLNERTEILESLTTVRRQTAMDDSGVPLENTLRSIRLILRGTVFYSELDFHQKPQGRDLALLATCIKAFQRAGTGRNRGRGKIIAALHDATHTDVTESYFKMFKTEEGIA